MQHNFIAQILNLQKLKCNDVDEKNEKTQHLRQSKTLRLHDKNTFRASKMKAVEFLEVITFQMLNHQFTYEF